MNFLYSKLVDDNNPDSIAQRFRNKRFAFLKSFLDHMPRPVTILDVGGTQSFWKMVDGVADVHVTV